MQADDPVDDQTGRAAGDRPHEQCMSRMTMAIPVVSVTVAAVLSGLASQHLFGDLGEMIAESVFGDWYLLLVPGALFGAVLAVFLLVMRQAGPGPALGVFLGVWAAWLLAMGTAFTVFFADIPGGLVTAAAGVVGAAGVAAVVAGAAPAFRATEFAGPTLVAGFIVGGFAGATAAAPTLQMAIMFPVWQGAVALCVGLSCPARGAAPVGDSR